MRRFALLLLAFLIATSSEAQTYTIKTLAGGALPNHIAGISAGIPYTGGVAVDPAGNVFFASAIQNSVYRVDGVTGLLTIVAGTGTQGYSGDNGPAASAQLGRPANVALDSAGNLYIVDGLNYVIRKVAGGVITTVAGNGVAAFAGDGGPATSASLNNPASVAFDGSGAIYIADSANNRIRKVTNGVITTVAGNGPGFAGDGGPPTSALLNNPQFVAVDASGNLFIGDTGNSRLREISNGVINTVISANTPGAGELPLYEIDGVALDTAGNLFVAVSNEVLEVANGAVTAIAGYSVSFGGFGFSGDGGPATSAQIFPIRGIAISGSGDLYLADGSGGHVRKVSKGVITTVAGAGATVSVGDGGPAPSAQFYYPWGVAVDKSGSVYVTDQGANRVRKITNGVITLLAGSGSPAPPNVGSEPASSAGIYGPTGVAADASGNVYYSDTGNQVVRKVSGGTVTTVAGGGRSALSQAGPTTPATAVHFSSPYGVAPDATGDFYFADYGAAEVYEVAANGDFSYFAGKGAGGVSGGDGSVATTVIVQPHGVAVGPAGEVYLTDKNRIWKVVNGIITTVAGNGTAGLSGDGGPAPAAQLGANPLGVAVDASGTVYIADTGNHAIRMVSKGVITTIAGTGVAGFSGDNGPASAAQLNTPTGIAVDAAGNVYIADEYNERIRILTPSTTCSVSVSPTSLTAQASGGSLSVTVNSGAGCPWLVQNLPSWIAASSSSGSGTATITLTVSANSGVARSALVSIVGILVSVAQQASATVVVIAPNGVVALGSTVSQIQTGSWVSIFGSNLASGTVSWNGDFPTSLGGVSVTIDGKPAYLSFVSPGQINLQVPDDAAVGLVDVVVTNGLGSATSKVMLATYAPSFILFDDKYLAAVIPTSDGSGAYGNGSYDLCGPSGYFSFNTRPAKVGEVVELYGVGFGPTNPLVPAGHAFAGTAPTAGPVTVMIGGWGAQVVYSGLTGAGIYQINVVIPSELASGDKVVTANVGGAYGGYAGFAYQTYLSVQ
jgi:uncharacterized protein (TIGR03437 family)